MPSQLVAKLASICILLRHEMSVSVAASCRLLRVLSTDLSLFLRFAHDSWFVAIVVIPCIRCTTAADSFCLLNSSYALVKGLT